MTGRDEKTLTDTTQQTQQFEEEDARATHRADRAPTSDEEKVADKNPLDPKVAEKYEEMLERGANVKGEGEI